MNIQQFSLSDGPGIRTTIFFWGCPLRCWWCSNPESQNQYRGILPPGLEAKEYSVEEALSAALRDRVFYEESGGGVTLSGGEPLQQTGFILELLRRLRREGIHTAVETTGYAPSEDLLRVARETDLLLFDCKHYDAEAHRQKTGVSNALILDNLALVLDECQKVIVRIPVIPGFNDSPGDAAQFCRLFRSLGVTAVHLLPFHQFGESKYQKMGLAYKMSGVGQLHPEQLGEYQRVFLDNGLSCGFQ